MTGFLPDDEPPEVVVDGHGVPRDVTSARRRFYGPPPPPRPARHVLDLPSVLGRRLILVYEQGPVYDVRAASEVWTDESGSWVKVVDEWRWYAYLEADPAARPSSCPRAVAWATTNVWVEADPDRPAAGSDASTPAEWTED